MLYIIVFSPRGKVYPAILDEWKNLRNIGENAVLCYVSLKTGNLVTENEQGELKS